MLKLSLIQLEAAVTAADAIHNLIAAKDRGGSAEANVARCQAYPSGLSVAIPSGALSAAIDCELQKQTKVLSDMGIELSPY